MRHWLYTFIKYTTKVPTHDAHCSPLTHAGMTCQLSYDAFQLHEAHIPITFKNFVIVLINSGITAIQVIYKYITPTNIYEASEW